MKTIKVIIIVRKEDKCFGYGLLVKGKSSDTVANKVRQFFLNEGFEIIDLEVKTVQ